MTYTNRGGGGGDGGGGGGGGGGGEESFVNTVSLCQNISNTDYRKHHKYRFTARNFRKCRFTAPKYIKYRFPPPPQYCMFTQVGGN